MGFPPGKFTFSRWTILFAIVGVICVIAVMTAAGRMPQVAAWVKVSAPAWLLPEQREEEEVKCYSTLEDEKFIGPAELAREQAEEGNVAAQVKLGTDYFWSHSIGLQGNPDRDYAEAEKWLGKAAAQGNIKAQVLLAKLYATGGSGAPPDWPQAYFWIVLSIERDAKYLPRCESLSLLKEAAGHLDPRQVADIKQHLAAWKPVVTPPKQKAKAGVKPAEAAEVPAPQPLPDVGDVCGAYAAGSHSYSFCKDRQQKIQHMLDVKTKRDKTYQPPASEETKDAQGPDAEKE
jgi:hypothetical protein